jgi:hypothetical protein
MYCPHFAAFCAHYGIVGDHDVFHHINANLRCQPTSQAHARRWAARFAELQSLRNVSERMFVTALVTGENASRPRLMAMKILRRRTRPAVCWQRGRSGAHHDRRRFPNADPPRRHRRGEGRVS